MGRGEMDALLSDLCGCDTEAVLRNHMPIHDGMSERVNARVTICRDSHDYAGSPGGEELLTCHGQIVIDGAPHRFVWSALYRGELALHSFLHVAAAHERRRSVPGPASDSAFPWLRRCNG